MSAAGPPSTGLDVPGLGRDLVVVDVEGNGASPPEIIEIATLAVDATGGQVGPYEVRSRLVRPMSPIRPVVTRLHGITNDHVSRAPLWTAVAPLVRAELGSRVLVAHSAQVERSVLAAHLPGWAPELVLDTLRLAQKVLPRAPGGYGLDNLAEYLNLPRPGWHFGEEPPVLDAGRVWRPHRAAYDVWMTTVLLAALVVRAGMDFSELARTAGLRPPARSTTRAEDDARDVGGLW